MTSANGSSARSNWLATAPVALCVLDIVFTLRGQVPEFWGGAWSVYAEGNPISAVFLRYGGPWGFVVAGVVWIAAIVLVTTRANRRIAFAFGTGTSLAHAWAASLWSEGVASYVTIAALCILAIAAAVMRSTPALVATGLLLAVGAVALPVPRFDERMGVATWAADRAFESGDVVLAGRLYGQAVQQTATQDEFRHQSACLDAATFHIRTGTPDDAVRILEPVALRIQRDKRDGLFDAVLVAKYAEALDVTGRPDPARDAAAYAASAFQKHEGFGTERAKQLRSSYRLDSDPEPSTTPPNR